MSRYVELTKLQRLTVYKAMLKLYQQYIDDLKYNNIGFCLLLLMVRQHQSILFSFEPLDHPELAKHCPKEFLGQDGKPINSGNFWFDTKLESGVLKRLQILNTIIEELTSELNS